MAGDFDFITFEEGLQRIRDATGKGGMGGGIVTSRDPEMNDLREKLSIKLENPGFKKWQLPVALDGVGAQFFVTVASPGASVGEHSHDEGDGLRYIVAGSIEYNGQELHSGDWMFIPKGARYSMNVGPMGASMFYCYQCCCVPV